MANLDPPFGSFLQPIFTSSAAARGAGAGLADGTAYDPSSGPPSPTTNFVGLPVAPQTGWGGGPNVSLGPPLTPLVWGVHSSPTPGGGLRVSWLLGGYTLNVSGTLAASGGACAGNCLGTLVPIASPAAFVPANTVFQHQVRVGLPGDFFAPSNVASGPVVCLQARRSGRAQPLGEHTLTTVVTPLNLDATRIELPAAAVFRRLC